MSELHRSEHDFLKLLLGLNTGAIGGLFFAQDRIVPHIKSIAALYATSLFLFLGSTALCLFGMRILINLEHTGLIEMLSDSEGTQLYQRTVFWKLLGKYQDVLNYSMILFFGGVLSTTILMMWNLRHHVRS